VAVSLSQIQSDWIEKPNRVTLSLMMELVKLLCSAVIGLFESEASLKAENLARRHQPNCCDDNRRSDQR